MSIKVIKPGIFSSIQDLGREGYRSLGIGPGGAMDTFAAALANYITGNDETVPVIEMHFPAAELLFETPALISITGANFDPCINDVAVEMYQPLTVQKDSLLYFKKMVSGARTYIAVHGGIEADKWLDSYSTNFKANAGGHGGRALQKMDILEIQQKKPGLTTTFFLDKYLVTSIYADQTPVRCIVGPEWETAGKTVQQNFLKNTFAISSQSDRMGYQLTGEDLPVNEALSLVSSAVNFGTLQLLPNGQLIILMADHQTTGGYPRLATVISADLPRLAQSPTGTEIQFQLASLQQAEDALISMHQKLTGIKNSCFKFYALH